MRNILKSKRAEGFTIIEVMIVLAIAGLIMVIVFIAVPQLQRNQRDNARQNIANRIKAEIETYAGNNQGIYPFGSAAHAPAAGTGSWNDFYTRYVSGGKVKVTDPSLGTDVIAAAGVPTGQPEAWGTAPCTAAAFAWTKGVFHVCFGASCNGELLQASGNATVNTRNYAVQIGLDRNGTSYCVDNG